jgi:hypothetical protein
MTLAPVYLNASTDEDNGDRDDDIAGLDLDIARDGEVTMQDIKSDEHSSNAAAEITQKMVDRDDDGPAQTWEGTIDKSGEGLEINVKSNEKSSGSKYLHEGGFFFGRG